MLTVEAIEENLSLQIQEDDISLTMQIADSAPSGVVVSGAPGNVLQTIPDGLYVPGPAEMPGFSSVGRTVATGTAAQGRGALGLGTAATRDVTSTDTDWTGGRVMTVGLRGLAGSSPTNAIADTGVYGGGFYRIDGTDPHNPGSTGLGAIVCTISSGFSTGLMVSPSAGVNAYLFARYANDVAVVQVRHSGNTTVDSNGFIKSASPILKLYSDRIETEIEAPSFERIGTGHYQLSSTNGLRLDDGWYIETPHDKNGNKYFNVEWEQDVDPDADMGVLEEPADVTLTIRCYERVWNPVTGAHENGDPVDIPEGRWIDLRMNEVRQPEPEIEEPDAQPELPPEPAEPVIPSVVPMASAKLALLYAGLYEPVEAYIEALPEPRRTAALIEWNHRQTLERDHPLVAQAASELGLTDQLLDELFMDAARR